MLALETLGSLPICETDRSVLD